MGMPSQYRIAVEAGHGAALVRMFDQDQAAPQMAVAWRDGRPIAVDMSHPLPPESHRIWPEHIAIGVLLVSTIALGLNQLLI